VLTNPSLLTSICRWVAAARTVTELRVADDDLQLIDESEDAARLKVHVVSEFVLSCCSLQLSDDSIVDSSIS